MAGMTVLEVEAVSRSGHMGKMRRRSCVVTPREWRKLTVDLIWERGAEIRVGWELRQEKESTPRESK